MKHVEIASITTDPVLNLALDTLAHAKQALIFVNTKKSAEKVAEDISKKSKLKDKALDELAEAILHALSKPTKQCERLAYCVKKGIAYHHAGLVHKQKELIEDAFRNKIIKIICCTPTLAYGLDLPAFRAIIRDLKRYGGRQGLSWIPVLEYLQQSGRAGRPKFDSHGESIAIASTEPEKDNIIDRYLNGEPEEIYSKLAVEPVLRTYLLSLIATRFVTTKKQIMEFFGKTFWAHQYKDMKNLQSIIEKMLRLLIDYEFIVCSEQDDFVSAHKISDADYHATAIGKRVAELYIDPISAYHIITSLKRASLKAFTSFSLLVMVSSTLEMQPLLRVRVKEYEEIQDFLMRHFDELLQPEPSMFEPDYEEFLHAVKTTLFFEEWINEKDEEFLLEKFNIRPGEIKVKQDIADWLLYAAEELTKLLGYKEIIKEIIKLRLRIDYGVKEELLSLLRLEGVGRVRARKLFNNKIRDIGDIKRADVGTLNAILGNAVSLKVKGQVDQEIKEIKPGKRKGQINLMDYDADTDQG
jgi:helicase